MAREDEILESLKTASQRLQPQEAADFWQKLEAVGEMDRSALLQFLNDGVLGGQCVLGAALVISCYADGPPSPRSVTQMQICESEAALVAQAFLDATGKPPITKSQPTRDEFLTLIEKWIEEVKEAKKHGFKDFLFYYAGTGCELKDNAFQFIPAGSKRVDDYIFLASIIAKIEEAEISGCNVIFGIDACRNSPRNVASVHVVEPPHNNVYARLFSTPSGNTAEHSGWLSPFAEQMAESIPRMTGSSQIDSILKEVMHAIRESVDQEEPVLQGIDRSSSSNSSVRNSSGSGPSLLSRLKKWGYSIFSMNLSATLRDSEVEDIRISHRRRVNRHTAPTEHPRFVIIGNTESASAAISDFKTRGMGPHYLILKDGSRRQLVKEKYMAWCYNFAFWESKDVGAPDDVPNTYPGVGKINELKTYAVSIVLEGDGSEPYDDKQYATLVSLLTDIKERWAERGGLPAWNVLSAGEVEQPPPACPSPGESFDWSRKGLVDGGFTLEVKGCEMTHLLEGLGFKDALQSRLREWGYEFGDGNDNTGLENRLRAFRHRYVRGQSSGPFEFSEEDFHVVIELLRLRSAGLPPTEVQT